MDRTAPASHSGHAGHDELLIVRLFGDDVTEAGRARALDLMADCPECADLFADLGSIAEASAALPIPARPRDFTLTTEDAARLRREHRSWRPALFGAGLRRSLGGSLSAIGLAGVLMTGAVSLLGGVGSTAANQASTGARAGAPEFAAAASAGGATQGSADLAMASGAPSPATPVVAPDGSPLTDNTNGSPGTKNASSQPSANNQPAPSSNKPYGPETQDGASSDAAGGDGELSAKTASSGEVSRGGIDVRIVWFAGFGVLFALGLTILILPRLLRRRG